MANQTKLPKEYENNPFFIATKGLTLLFDLARGVAILFVVLSILNMFSGNWQPDDTPNQSGDKVVADITHTVSNLTTNEWITGAVAVVIIGMALLLVAALFGGVSAYTSAQIAKGHKVSLGEAFRVSFEHLWAFLWLQIIIGVKTFLWFLLLIIPGIVMSVRYSLASVAFFDKNLRGNAAVKESLRLTKGAWLTTFAGNALFNYITLGIISWVVATGANAILYRQFDKLGDKKPEAHWLSWLTLVLPFVLIALLIALVVIVLAVIAATGAKFSE